MKKTAIVFTGLVFIAVGLYLGYASYANKKAAGLATEIVGVSKDKIIIGSSAALSGPAAFLGTEYLRGAQAYLNKINEEGGVNGRKIELISYDDQYDPVKTVVNTQKLIAKDKVFMLFNYVGTPTTISVIPMINEAKIPLLGVFSGAEVFRKPLQEYIINIRASYHQEIAAFIDGAVKELGFNKIAVLYQSDVYGVDGLKGAELALAKHGLKPVVITNYKRGTLDVEGALTAIENYNPQAIVIIGTYGPAAKFIKLAKADDFNPIFYNVSFVGSEALVSELGKDAEGMIITEVVPLPQEKNSLIDADDYPGLLKKYFPQAKPTFGGLEGFMNAKVLVEGLKRCGDNLNRKSFIKAVESIQNHSLGTASPVNFCKTDHQGSQQVFLTYVKDGQFVLLKNWSEIKQFIKN